MTKEQMHRLAKHLGDLATSGGMMSAGVMFTVQFGYVDDRNIVKHDGVRIMEAPPLVVKSVVEWCSTENRSAGFVAASVHGGGLHVS